MRCGICGKPKGDDLFAAVTDSDTCSICTVRFVGGLPLTEERLNKIRAAIGLKDGEYLEQDHAKEAARILGRE